MNSSPSKPVTALLHAWSGGDAHARDELLTLIYGELRRRAAAHFRRERRGHSLQPTALVHEAYLRLIGQQVTWKNRAHFFGLASEMMRRILVDHARARKRNKRAGGWTRVELDEAVAMAEERDLDLVALDRALQELSALDPRHGRMVELRFFGGLTLEEAAEVLGASSATVKRDWALARAWLYQRLKNDRGALPEEGGQPS
jgi:RNA polymerase sigma factor (TIGR02999 family)